MSEWRPIEEYDKKIRKPPAVFLFAYVPPTNALGHNEHDAMISTSRRCGRRVCIGYAPIPEFDRKQDNAVE